MLSPQDTLGKGHLDDVAMRIVCRVKPPVGGISVKEHLEINLVPLVIQITNQFYRAMMSFFFPGNNIDQDDSETGMCGRGGFRNHFGSEEFFGVEEPFGLDIPTRVKTLLEG